MIDNDNQAISKYPVIYNYPLFFKIEAMIQVFIFAMPIIGFTYYLLFAATFSPSLLLRYCIFLAIMGLGLYLSIRKLASFFSEISIGVDGIQCSLWGNVRTSALWSEIAWIEKIPDKSDYRIITQQGIRLLVNHRFVSFDEFKAHAKAFLSADILDGPKAIIDIEKEIEH